MDAAVTGQAQISDARLESVKLQQRQCTIQGEMKLKHFDTYTNPYCLLDCLTEALVAQCGCVPYYYPGIFLPKLLFLLIAKNLMRCE